VRGCEVPVRIEGGKVREKIKYEKGQSRNEKKTHGGLIRGTSRTVRGR